MMERTTAYQKLDRAYDLIRDAIHQDRRLYSCGLDEAMDIIVRNMERVRTPLGLEGNILEKAIFDREFNS